MAEAGISGNASNKAIPRGGSKRDQRSAYPTKHSSNPSLYKINASGTESLGFRDAGSQAESTVSQIQSELEDLQFKLDEMKNRSLRSNLRFVGVPKEMESVTKVISDLISDCILPESPKIAADLSIMRAHRVLFTHSANLKHPRTILVNFGAYRIKEQILSQAIKKKKFKFGDSFSFRVFSDMSVIAAHRRREFVGLIDDFKVLGAPTGIGQLSKLKVLHKG
ncbi:hypothetical protein NDU88_007254 [Pleurodeles waltl]|uniref:L1 transposable element RRM domain-containing protein n=1 Tax=Pleurodeles waltl TaxID=8319 RepID=A0AAV7PNR3_PLEWA|nr:hypothetical protein NDU88_007254 [Pleurodeles waltl]